MLAHKAYHMYLDTYNDAAHSASVSSGTRGIGLKTVSVSESADDSHGICSSGIGSRQRSIIKDEEI